MSRTIKNQKTEKMFSLKAIVITAIVSGMIGLSYNLLEDSLQRLLFSDKNELEYEILSSKELTKTELNKIVDANFEYSKLDLLFDDSIITKYQYTVFELRNNGSFIEGDLFFDLDFKDERIKILDVLCKIMHPVQKEIEVEIEKPPLEYEVPFRNKDTLEVNLEAGSDEDDSPSNYSLIWYRSYTKSGGYGRRNPKVVKTNSFKESVKKGERFWYSAAVQPQQGSEYPLSNVIPYPEYVFNYPYFKDTKVVSVEKLNGEVNTDSLLAAFIKIKNDLQKGEKIFVNLQESEFKKRLITEYDENIPIYFRDDVRFLNGKTTVYLKNIVHKAKIRFHIVSKTYIQYEYTNLDFSLRDIKDIYLTRVEPRFKKTTRALETEQTAKPKQKDNLTPFRTRIVSGKDKIVLAWSKPKTKTYKGVRIFKAPYVQTNLELTWEKADEIYDDKGNLGVIIANYRASNDALTKEKPRNGTASMISQNQDSTPPPAPPSKVSIGKVNKFDKFDPPARTDSLGRSKTVTLTIRLGITPHRHPVNIDDDGSIMYYFEDTEVKLNESYIYTLIAYDDQGNYSYPIESIIKYGDNEHLPRLETYNAYENNPDILNLLRDHYKLFNDSLRVMRVDSLLNVIEKDQTRNE